MVASSVPGHGRQLDQVEPDSAEHGDAPCRVPGHGCQFCPRTWATARPGRAGFGRARRRAVSSPGTWLPVLSQDMGDSSAQPNVADDVADAPRSGDGCHRVAFRHGTFWDTRPLGCRGRRRSRLVPELDRDGRHRPRGARRARGVRVVLPPGSVLPRPTRDPGPPGGQGQGRASRIMKLGVSVARRNRVKPASSMTRRSSASPA